MEKGEGNNQTYVTEFNLLGFGNFSELQILLFLLFLVIYIVTVAGNILIMVLVVTDQHLHTPMYFLLGNLSCLETCYSSTILPRVLASLLTGDRTISVSGCITQFYFFGVLVASECYLLSVMSYDRYLAICKPLHYMVLMNGRICLQLATVSWMGGFMATTIVTCLMSQLHFCGPNEIDHFLCDFTPVIKLSCSDTSLITLVTFILSSIDTLPPFLFTLTSYVFIISTILRIPSTTGRRKAFSTCSSHLIVVTVFYGTLMIVYVLPDTETLRELNKVFSLFYTILTPMVNPLIYSLRNKEVHCALRKLINNCVVRTEIEKGVAPLA
ncbi:olfactory receptor 11A1-like [Terrapene carolina triunguis]|uniref:olfactory receptor 11A1-like n=1 Tax=Terrapene triunguis TaxID=2587831 RepID=UPI000CEFFEA2|nr:olfactory receptor 11A1-like [Terrapene carolina triunguis]